MKTLNDSQNPLIFLDLDADNLGDVAHEEFRREAYGATNGAALVEVEEMPDEEHSSAGA